MSNIAGKAYAMNVITPLSKWTAWIQKLTFWALTHIKWSLVQNTLRGLQTLSLIHYARWVILRDDQFPHLHPSQPREKLKYHYMIFSTNFNGSWDQYVDSFSMAISTGLDLFWFKNIKYPCSVPIQPFHHYIKYNQVWTDHYYNAYPMAASNDIKGAQSLKEGVCDFISHTPAQESPLDFQRRFNQLLLKQQHNLSPMSASPIVSLSAAAVAERLAGIPSGA